MVIQRIRIEIEVGEMKDLSSRRELFTELSKLFRVTFVIPRVSHEETTVAVISFFPTEKGKKILRKVDDLLPYFRSAVKRWVKETEEGAAAFRYACDDLNIGDVVSHDNEGLDWTCDFCGGDLDECECKAMKEVSQSQ